jgi:hypothetical protein
LGCDTSRGPYFLESLLTDGGEVSASRVSRPLPPGRFLVLISVTGQGHSAAGRIRPTEKANDLIGNRTRDLPTQLTTLVNPPNPKKSEATT